MTIQEILNIATQLSPYIIGTGGLLYAGYQRKLRNIALAEKEVALKHQEAGALQKMQVAYDTFVTQSMGVINRLEKEIETLNTKIDKQTKAFEEYKEQCNVIH